MSELIQPRTLKGFRDYLPELMIPRERLLEQVRRVCRSYGFAPIDTPALEFTEILLGKGGEESDKLIYRFVDHGGRDVVGCAYVCQACAAARIGCVAGHWSTFSPLRIATRSATVHETHWRMGSLTPCRL